MSKHRTQRLKKKLHLDEFSESGFALTYTCPGEAEMAFLAALHQEVLGSRAMAFIYLSAGRLFISGLEGSLTPQDRAGVETWLAARRDITSWELGPLEDAWHPPRSVRAYSAGRRSAVFLISPVGA